MTTKHILNLKDIPDYTNILKYFSKHSIEIYLYTIKWQGSIIKFGISYKNGSRRPMGDRIYTQAGYFPGWDKKCLSRGPKSKLATEEIIKELENKYSTKVHKNDIIIEIDDYTGYKFINPDNPYAEMQNEEERLKQDFYKKYDRYPIGNKKQEGIRFVATIESSGLFWFGDE